jgi:hypothetical protein
VALCRGERCYAGVSTAAFADCTSRGLLSHHGIEVVGDAIARQEHNVT